MFADYTWTELGSIFAMQGFAGLILFSVFVLMALGLAIIFGQMGVINMAHGEFMILGAYVTYLCSNFVEAYAPALFGIYFFFAMALAFVAAGALGALVEWSLIRHLYKRPLDTLLATWGLSLILQQAYRSIFGAREVGVSLAELAARVGAFHRHHRDPDQRHLRHGADLLHRHRRLFHPVPLAHGHADPRRRAEPRHGRALSASIHEKVDRNTFALGCGIAGIAGSAFTMIGSTGPTAGQLYIVDTFLIVVFRRRCQPARNHRLVLRHQPGAVDHGILPVGLHGQGPDAPDRRRHPDAAPAGPVLPENPSLRRF